MTSYTNLAIERYVKQLMRDNLSRVLPVQGQSTARDIKRRRFGKNTSVIVIIAQMKIIGLTKIKKNRKITEIEKNLQS